MERFSTNLFPIGVNWKNLHLHLYGVKGIPNTEGRRKTLNRLRYRLSSLLGSPTFYTTEGEEILFYTFKRSKDEIEIHLGEEEVFILTYRGETSPPKPRREVLEWVIEDIIRLGRLKERFQRRHLLRKRLKTQLGEVILYPTPLVKVYGDRDFLLQVDLKFRLTTDKTIQDLLEEGILTPSQLEGNENFKIKPYGFDRTSYAVRVFKASDLDLRELEAKLKVSARERTKREWKTLLEDREKRTKTYLVQLANGYLYPATLLKPVLDFERLGEGTAEVLKDVKLDPNRRFELISDFLRELIPSARPYGVSIQKKPLKVGEKNFLKYHREVVDSQNLKMDIETSLLPFLVKCKPFVKKPILRTKVVFITDDGNPAYANRVRELVKSLGNFLREKGIKLDLQKEAFKFFGATRGEVIKQLSTKLGEILGGNPDLILVFTPEYGVKNLFEEITIYDYLKKRFLENGIASQFVLKNTLLKNRMLDYVVYNVAEQIMGKTGNVPYRLSKNLEDVDVFVGLDISRVGRKQGGSVNEGAFTKIFFSNGSFLKYSLSSSTSFGEEFTQKAIYELFLRLRESGIGEGKRIVIHRDGFFRGRETEIFTKLARDFGYKLELVEVIKRNNPRFFGRKIKGLYLPLSEREVLIATYNSPPNSTHQPIRIRLVKGELPLEKHASYILSFTLLNYSSFKPVKLPATTYHTDRMAKLSLRGLKPSKTEGEDMFWL